MLPLLFLVACSPRPLERQGVDIVFGMRLNEPRDVAELSPNLAALRDAGLRKLLIELPMKADSNGLPKVTVDAPAEIVGLMGRFKVELNLAFCSTNREELFPDSLAVDEGAWFAQLEAEIGRNLSALSAYPPDRVVIGGALGPVLPAKQAWKGLLERLRAAHKGVFFSVGGDLEALEESGLANVSDELAIDYAPIAGEVQKAESRTENQAIAAAAKACGKPVFLYRANLIGPDPVAQFRNRLRFWEEGVQLTGICINTLYPRVVLRDDSPYYGRKGDSTFVQFLQSYKAAAFE